MPPKTYMVVDGRHDHSIRIPRPDLSVKYGTPNACNTCHEDKDAEWAAEMVESWYGHTLATFQTYAGAFYAARHEIPGAGDALAEVIRETEAPSIARATALTRIGPYLSPKTLDLLTVALSDAKPDVRVAAVRALEYVPPGIRVRLAFRMLSDSVRGVRMEAAAVLASVPTGELATEQQSLLDRGLKEYIAAQEANAERPEAQTNLGNLYAGRGDLEKATAAYRTAIDLNSAYVPAYINLADLYRLQGYESKAEMLLRRATDAIPRNADVHHALGLSLARQQRNDEAVEEFRLATTLNPESARYVYVYAVALNSTGSPEEAVMVLQGAHNAHPNDADILSALVAFHRNLGNQEAANAYAEKLRARPR